MADPKTRTRLGEVPRPALVLGFAGLLPFFGGTLGAWWLGYPDFVIALNLQMAYGAVILSFLGAAHWGLALAQDAGGDWQRLGIAVLPALASWIALMIPNALGLLLLAVGFGGVFLADRQAVAAGRAPAWYKALRKPLTLLVLLCLGGSYAALAFRL